MQAAAHEDIYRLKSISLYIPTDEQIAKARAKSPDVPVAVSARVAWEPLTYRKTIGGDVVQEEVDYMRLTTGRGLSTGNEAENIAKARAAGLPGIDSSVRMRLPNPKTANPDKMEQEFKRFYVSAGKAGLVIDVDEDGSITGQPGQLYSKQVGKIYACQSPTQFPTVNSTADGKFDSWNWDDTKSSFVRIPVREVTDFVQPEQIPTRAYERREGSDEAQTPGNTTTAAPAAVTPADLKAAVAQLGLAGKTVSVVNASATSVVASNIAKNPTVLGSTAVAKAAQSGKFVDWLASEGVVMVEDGKVVLVG